MLQKLLCLTFLLGTLCTISNGTDKSTESALTKKYISQAHVAQAQAQYAKMAQYAKIRCWIGFAVKVALGAADTYVLLSPLITGKGTEFSGPIGWSEWTKHLLMDMGTAAVKSVILEIVKDKAEPLLAQFREKNYIPVHRCWFLSTPGQSRYVALTHEMVCFIELLQLLDAAVFNVMHNGTSYSEVAHLDVMHLDVAKIRRHEAMLAVVATAEKILGHVRHAQACMLRDNMVGAATADGVAQRLELLVEDFCTAVDTASSTENKFSILCDTFMQEYQAELLLLRSVPAYMLEQW